MKKLLLPFAFFLLPFFAKAQTDAFQFLESLNKEFSYLQELQVDYISNLVHRGTDMKDKNTELQSAVASAIKAIEALPTPANDKGLKKSSLETFKGMDDMTQKNHNEAVLKKAGCTDCFAAAEVEYNEMKAASDEVSKSFSKMQKKIEVFAKENEIKLVDSKNEFDIIISKVNRINDYLQLIDLCVMQAYYAGEDVVKKFNEKNQKAAASAIKKLEKELGEAGKRLKGISGIQEDAICIKKAELLLAFYKQMAEEIYPDMLSAFDKKGEFTKAGANIFNKNIDKINRQLPPKRAAYDQSKAELLMKNVPKPSKTFKG
jgi:hypothetical protein